MIQVSIADIVVGQERGVQGVCADKLGSGNASHVRGQRGRAKGGDKQ
jgi:hypothetical protein